MEELEQRSTPSANVLEFHNDWSASGQNLAETALTPTNVNPTSFGKLFATNLDGQVYTQPLVDNGVPINVGGQSVTRDAVFVATENDSLYAIDADDPGQAGSVLWQRSFLDPSNSSNNTLGASAITTVPSGDTGSTDISPEIGITGTPVIDAASNTLYLVAKTKETIGGNSYYVQRLHAINLSDGTDRVSPYLIGETTNGNSNTTAIYSYGTGDGSVTDPYNGTGQLVVQFNALREHQRAALSLVNNTVYVEWASHGDNGPYHGWVAAWDVANLTSQGFALSGVFNSCPNNGEAGIWEGGGGLVFEPDGSACYAVTGNGTAGAPTLNAQGFPANASYNEAVIKLTADSTTSPTTQGPNGWGFKVVDYFIPYNVTSLDYGDVDFGSGGPLLLPASAGIVGHPNLMLVGGKAGTLYVLDRNNLGHFGATTDNVVSEATEVNGLLNTPAWYNGHIYVVSGYSSNAVELGINADGTLSAVSQTAESNFGYLPGSPSVSANGSTNGIVWVMDRNLNAIHAYDASSLNTELWNSAEQSDGSDAVGGVVKFATPTVADGEVFVGTTDSLVVYGLFPPSPPGYVALDAGGGSTGVFLADQDYSGGRTAATAASINTSGVSNPAPAAVYQSVRYGNFSYLVPNLTPGGSYSVRLDFAEIYWSSAGQRVFNVAINGQQVLSNFDIYAAAGGADIALARSFTATADASGQIVLTFTTVQDNAMVNGIEISPAAAGALGAPTGLTATPSSGQVALSWNAVAGASSYNVYRATSSGAEGSTPLATGITGTSYTDATVSSGTYYYEITAVNNTSESNPSGEASATVPLPPGNVSLDAGGGSTGVFLADQDYSGGRTAATAASINTGGVNNPAPAAVYQSVRYGNFSYTVPNLTPGASYSVRLDFAEIYWSSAGERVFNVAINGQQVLSNFDIYAAAGGKDIALARTFTATADASGQIVLTFTTVQDNAMVNGIEISPAAAGALGAPTGLTATPSTGQVALSWNAVAGASSYNVYRATSSGAEGSTPLATGITGTSYTDATVSSGTYYYEITTVNNTSESNPSGEASATVPLPPGNVALDAGGGSAGVFLADQDYSGGRTAATAASINTSGVSNPAPAAVYQSVRYGNFSYTVPNLTPGASYSVRLDFAEIYWNSAGQRVFDVLINGSQVLTNFDIYAAAGGKDIALARTFTATADASGQIVLTFTTVQDNAMVNGIEISPMSA